MDQQLKQRLVGIGVIFSIAVIFLPMILDGSGQQMDAPDVDIPTPPRIVSKVDVSQKVIELKREVDALPDMAPLIVDEISEPPEEEKQQTAPKVSDTKKPETKTQIVKQTQAETPAKKPVVKKEAKKAVTAIAKIPPKPQVGGDSWVIQVGSFQDRDKAFKQRDNLRKSRLSAVFIEKFEQKGKLSYRVRMGPFLKRDKANVVRNKVLAKYNIKGLVMKYEK